MLAFNYAVIKEITIMAPRDKHFSGWRECGGGMIIPDEAQLYKSPYGLCTESNMRQWNSYDASR